MAQHCARCRSRRRPSLIGALAALALLVSWRPDASAQSSPPPTTARPVTDTLHGVAVTDPYRWMEEGGAEFTEWLRAQDAYTRAVLARFPGRARLLADLRAASSDATVVGDPRLVAGRYFYLQRKPGEQIAKLYVREVGEDAGRVLVDAATLDAHGQRFAVTEFEPSPDGRYVAFRAAPDGAEIGSFRVVEVASARQLPDTIARAFYLGGWRPDGNAFTYTRLRELPPDAPSEQLEQCAVTYLHVLGTDPAGDPPLVGCGISPKIPVTGTQQADVEFFSGSKYALADVALNTGGTLRAFYVAPIDSLAGPATPWRRLAGPDDQVFEAVLRGDSAYVVTHLDAPRSRVVCTSVVHPDLAHGQSVLPASDLVVAPHLRPAQQGLSLARDALYVHVLKRGSSRLLRVPFDGSPTTEIELPYPGSILHVSTEPSRPGVIFSLESWTRSPLVYVFDPATGSVRDTHLAPPGPGDREAAVTLEVEVRSADGTRVPLSIVVPAKLSRDGSHPTLVEAYGAYGMVDAPAFRAEMMPWLDRGGIFAVCHARGGGEYGEPWHRAGQKGNKPNTVADFVACAKYLVSQGYTTHRRMAGLGVSAGGLAVGGVITRHPDLFAAALAFVPVTDLLRFEFWRNGPINVPEFGSVKSPDDFRAMRAVSPYANIRKGTRYPAVLVTTGNNDRRVSPAQAAKFVARLQASTASGKPVLLRVDWSAGHQGGATAEDDAAGMADILSFLLWQTGVAEFRPGVRSAAGRR